MFKFKIFIVICFLFLLTPALVFAEDFTLQVNIPGSSFNFSTPNCSGDSCNLGWISKYIAMIYKFGVGLAIMLAVVMIMVGGFIWLMSAGSPDKVGKAKEFITSAMTGLLLALFSFLILQTVNPELISGTGRVNLPTSSTSSSGTEPSGGSGDSGGADIPEPVEIDPGDDVEDLVGGDIGNMDLSSLYADNLEEIEAELRDIPYLEEPDIESLMATAESSAEYAYYSMLNQAQQQSERDGTSIIAFPGPLLSPDEAESNPLVDQLLTSEGYDVSITDSGISVNGEPYQGISVQTQDLSLFGPGTGPFVSLFTFTK